jgi:hypothetical protein
MLRLSAALGLAIVACGAPGRPSGVAPVEAARPLLIRYRTLTRADFQAGTPPADRPARPEGHGALSCIRLVPELPLRVVVEADADGLRRAHARRAAFHAEFDCACSWWNPRTARARAPYLLAHEQAHFAIVELHARRLTLRVRRLAVPVGSSREAAETFQRAMAPLVDSSAAEIRRESEALDRETLGRSPTSRQAEWLRRLAQALRELEHVRQ